MNLMTSIVTAHTLTLCQHTAPNRQASPMILLLLNPIVYEQKPTREGQSCLSQELLGDRDGEVTKQVASVIIMFRVHIGLSTLPFSTWQYQPP